MRSGNLRVGIMLPAVAMTAWLWVSFQKTNQASLEEGRDQVTFDQYVLTWAAHAGSAVMSHLPGRGVTALDDMFPEAPKAWTRRNVSGSDGKALSVNGLDTRRQALMKDAATRSGGASERMIPSGPADQSPTGGAYVIAPPPGALHGHARPAPGPRKGRPAVPRTALMSLFDAMGRAVQPCLLPLWQ